MSAPIGTSILDITGRWRLNRDLSDSLEATFALQGIPWVIRKIINMAELELQYVKLPSADDTTATRFSFKQTVRPGGFDTKNEYIIDGNKRSNTVPIFGDVTVYCNYLGHNDITQEQVFGRQIEIADEDHAAILEVVSNETKGWFATNVWAFETIDGARRLCKYNTTKKGEKTTTAVIVHDYTGGPII